MRRLAAGAAIAAVVTVSGCTTPEHAIVTSCQGSYSEKECTVTIERFEKSAFTSFEIDSNNLGMELEGTFTVRSGTAKVLIKGGETTEYTVTADKPTEVTLTSRFSRARGNDEDNFFVFEVAPEGVVEGFSGTLTYRAVARS